MKEELWKLIETHNQELSQDALSETALRSLFEAAWPDLEAQINSLWRSAIAEDPRRKPDRRIHNYAELVELWPALLMRIRKNIGVTAVAYLHDARPFAFNDGEVVLAFTKRFHYEKATDAMKRLPFEETINGVLDRPRKLRLILEEKEATE